jgi:hypothetical protein
MDGKMKVIANSQSAECLVKYLSICNEPLKSQLIVETGYISKIGMDESAWEALSELWQKVIWARTQGFIDGWEMSK